MKYLFIGCFLSIVSICNAQQPIIIYGHKTFKATNTWDFHTENYSFGHPLEVKIGVENASGILMLSIETSQGEYIWGNILIILDDGNTITCIDRKIRDRTNGKSKSLYILTNSEVKLLASSQIQLIRFGIAAVHDKFNSNSEPESYEAKNNGEYVNRFEKFKTNQEIDALLPKSDEGN